MHACMRKIYSVARNLGLHFVMCSQRLQDLNTKIRGRTRLMVGQISLDDYELKINRLLRHSKYRKNVLSLPKGVFLYPTQDMLISFSKFKQDSKPYQYRPKEEPKPESQTKKKGILERIRDALTPKNPITKQPIGSYTETEEDSEEDIHDSLDTDLLLWEEFEDEEV